MVPENSEQIHCTTRYQFKASSATVACAKFDIYNASIFTIKSILSPRVTVAYYSSSRHPIYSYILIL